MKKTLFLITIALVVSLTACDSFFSTSWGISRNYKLENVELDLDNLEEYKQQAVGNPDLARVAGQDAAQKLREMKESGASGEDRAKFMDAAVEFAWIGSEMDTFILGHAGGLADLFMGKDTDASLDDMADDFIKSVGSLSGNPGFIEAVDNFAAGVDACLVEGSTGNGEAPHFIPEYKETVDASSVDKAVLLLVAGLVDEEDENWDNFGKLFRMYKKDSNGQIVVDNPRGGELDPATVALAAYFNLMTEDDEIYNNSLIAASIYDRIVR